MPQQGTFIYTAMEQVIYGIPAADALAQEVDRLDANHVFLLTSGTLNRETNEVENLKATLGNRFAGLCDHMPAHTPRDAVIDAANAARDASADLIVTFGGGSTTDGGKVMQIALEHDLTDQDELDAYRLGRRDDDGKVIWPEIRSPRVRQITIPTTLSAGEFSSLGGCTDTRIKAKQGYNHRDLIPRTVILDPAVTIHTPEWLWLSTGIRAVDHAVESLCSTRPNAFVDGTAMQALRLLKAGLEGVKADPGDLEARMKCQMGAWASMTHGMARVPTGASHGIGHVLGGTCDVPHGYTSCVMLPFVMKWNKPENAEQQAIVAEALGAAGTDAGDALDAFIRGLGLPRSLRDVGISRDQFQVIAEGSMHDPGIRTNPRSISGPDDILEILELAY